MLHSRCSTAGRGADRCRGTAAAAGGMVEGEEQVEEEGRGPGRGRGVVERQRIMGECDRKDVAEEEEEEEDEEEVIEEAGGGGGGRQPS